MLAVSWSGLVNMAGRQNGIRGTITLTSYPGSMVWLVGVREGVVCDLCLEQSWSLGFGFRIGFGFVL